MLQKNEATRVLIIGLLPRPDVAKNLVTEANNLLYEAFTESYISPRDIKANGHFLNDNVHLSPFGIYHAARMFQRIFNSVK